MNPAMMMAALQFLQSDQGKQMMGSVPGLSGLLGPLSSLGGSTTPAAQAQETVAGALQLLADHMPADPTEYIKSITQALLGLAAVKLLAVQNAVAPVAAPASGGLSSIPILGSLLSHLPGA
jgi:phage tail tape-measure protein